MTKRFPGALAPLLLAAILFLAVAPAGAQSGGNEPRSGKTSQDGFTVIDLMNPITGVSTGRQRIRAFQVYSSTGCRLMLKIFRPYGLSYRLVGASNAVTVYGAGIDTFSCDIPVIDGDLVGYTTLDLGSGGIDYTDDNPDLAASVVYTGDVGTVLKENGTTLPYVRSIRVYGLPSADVPVTIRAGNHYVPVVTRGGSLTGSFFRTEGMIYNASTADLDFSLSFTPEGIDGTTTTVTKTITIAARKIWTVNDVVRDVFGYEAATGFLRVAGVVNFKSLWRIVNETEHGDFGQDVPTFFEEETLLYDSQVTGFEGDGFDLIGAEQGENRRTNLGVMNLSTDSELEFRIQPFGDGGAPLAAEKTVKIPKWSLMRYNGVLSSMFDLSPSTTRVRLRLTPNDSSLTQRLWCYLSVIDNVSGDPVFVSPAKTSSN
jgi:hypothetical protein